jgi:cytochrome c553
VKFTRRKFLAARLADGVMGPLSKSMSDDAIRKVARHDAT